MATLTIHERAALTDRELNTLFAAAWPEHRSRLFQRELAHALTYFGAYDGEQLVGFIKVVWDGGLHAFLLDPTVLPDHQRQGIGTALVHAAVKAASAAGAEWVHVDYLPVLDPFYKACGFRSTAAGVRRRGHQRNELIQCGDRVGGVRSIAP